MSSINVNRLYALTGHRDCVYSIATGRNFNEIYSAGGDGLVVHWNLKTPDLGEVIAKLESSIYAIHFVDSMNMLVVAQNFNGLHFIDPLLRKELTSLKISDNYIFDLSSHENKLFVAVGNGSVKVVDLTDFQIIKSLNHSDKSARCIAINKKQNELAVGYSDNFIRVFDLRSYALKQEWLAHENSIFTLQYHPDGNLLLSGSRDARLRVWNANEEYLKMNEIVAHMYTINHIAFSPDTKHFVTCSMDKSIKVWDSQEFKLLKVIDKARHAGHGTSVNKLT